jgi:phosphocarrier protein
MNTLIFLIAHAPLAHALRECALHVFSDCGDDVRALDVRADAAPEQTLERACALLEDCAERPVLVLTDLFGATPCNMAQRLVEGRAGARLVTGVNLPCSCAPSATAPRPWTCWFNAPSSAARKALCKWPCARPKIKSVLSMIKTRKTISNKLGLHARASAKLTKVAASFPCDVWMSRGERRINAKSIMGVMMLAAGMGTDIDIETDGAQEQEAMDALLALIEDKFGEGQ